MTGQMGDRVVVEPKGVAHTARGGVIEEVLQQEPPRYRVRWDDGRESIIVPASGSIRIETAKGKATRKKPARKA
jgi:Domain of unknown function (DUF1918)